MNINLQRQARKSGRSVVDQVVQKDLLGGNKFILTGSIGYANSFSNADSGNFPVTQSSTFQIYAICGVSVCGDGSIAGP